MFKFKSKLIVAVMLVVGVAAFMGCEKETNKELSKSNNSFNISNSNNPYDNLGASHNKMCIRFIKDKEKEIRSNSLNNNDVFKYFNTSAEIESIVSTYYEMSLQSLKKLKSTKSTLYSEYPLLIEAYTKLRDEIMSSSNNLEQKINLFVKFENEILDGTNDYLFKDIEEKKVDGIKNAILVACAVGRYSLFLWSSQEDGGLGYYNFINKTTLKSSAPPYWVYDDLWGAWGSALLTANPFSALGGGAVSSAIAVLRHNLE